MDPSGLLHPCTLDKELIQKKHQVEKTGFEEEAKNQFDDVTLSRDLLQGSSKFRVLLRTQFKLIQTLCTKLH